MDNGYYEQPQMTLQNVMLKKVTDMNTVVIEETLRNHSQGAQRPPDRPKQLAVD